MALSLTVDTDRWRAHLDTVVAATPGLVGVVKGNGYGLGRDTLAAEAGRLGLDQIAVGTYAEVPDALAGFDGDVMVLSPWRPFLTDAVDDPRVIHTVGRVEDVAALAADRPGSRVVVEGESSMARHGIDRHHLTDLVDALGDLVVDGVALHLPLTGGHLGEALGWAAAVQTSRLEAETLYVSHLSGEELATFRQRRPEMRVRPRVGTGLWLGDLGGFDVRSTVLDVHPVRRGQRIGYRQRPMPRHGHLVIVSGGTSHGIGLVAPRGAGGAVARGKALAKGGLEAAGFALSPFTITGRQRWYAEPPHMQASMVFLPDGAEVPAVGDTVPVAVRYTTTTFDHLTLS